MNKRIKKKHKSRFNLIGFSFFELEQKLGHDIDHKIKRSLMNRRCHEYRKEPENNELVEFTSSMWEKINASVKMAPRICDGRIISVDLCKEENNHV